MTWALKDKSRSYVFFFWIGFLIVLIMNILVWLYLNQVEAQFRNNLQNRLQDSNQILGRLVNRYNQDVNLETILPGDRSSLAYFYFQQPLDEIRLQTHLQSIVLLSTRGDILISSPEQISRQKTSSVIQRAEFKAAIQGKAVVSEVEEYAGEKFMSAFAPIKNDDGFIIAVLVSEAKADYFSVLTQLRNRIFTFSLLSFVVILFTAFFLFRMIRRSMQYQAEIKDQEHLVQLGTMASTVAHELRNPLGIIEGAGDLIKKKYGNGNDEIFRYISDEVQRLNRLIDDLLRISRTPQLHITELNIGELVQRLKMSLSEPERKRLVVNIEPRKQSFHADANLIEQALLNLLRNAAEAGSDGKQMHLSFAADKKKYLKIILHDEGPGVPQDIQDKIFEPFFTTKEKGSGLGLAITKHIVTHLQGEISLTSKSGKGTTVEILLPDLQPLKVKGHN